MKIVTLILIAIMMAAAVVNTSSARDVKPQRLTNIITLTFEQAIQYPGLVTAMYQQIKGGFLGGPGAHYISFKVHYQHRWYLITGTVDQWESFFSCKAITRKYTTPGN